MSRGTLALVAASSTLHFSSSREPYHLPKPFHSPSAAAAAAAAAAAVDTLAMVKSLNESDVGIFCYVSSLPGFRAVLKQRYSDFIVNEVDLDGKIVRLTCCDPPPECAEEKGEENSTSFGQKSFTDEIELFLSLAGDADAELLKDCLVKVAADVDDELPPLVLAPDCDKSHRAEVHNFFKKNFKFLVTDTVDGEDGSSKSIRVRFSSGKGGKGRRGKKRKGMKNSGWKDDKPFDRRGADSWPEDRGKFISAKELPFGREGANC